jgi:hypothetical protein
MCGQHITAFRHYRRFRHCKSTSQFPATAEQKNDHPAAMDEDIHPIDISKEAPWKLVRSSKRRPHEPPLASHETKDYEERIFSMRLALRAASLTSRQKLAVEFALLVVEAPLLLVSHSGKMPAKTQSPESPLSLTQQPPHPNALVLPHLTRHTSP